MNHKKKGAAVVQALSSFWRTADNGSSLGVFVFFCWQFIEIICMVVNNCIILQHQVELTLA